MFAFILIAVFVVVSMIGINALYVAGEFAAVSARKGRVVQAANEGNRLAKLLLPVLQDHHKLDNYIAASQVGITLSSIILGIYGQGQIAPVIAPLIAQIPFLSDEAAALGVSSLLVLAFLTTLQVVLGELVPKSLALQYPEEMAYGTALPMSWSANWLLRPFIILLNGSGALLLKLLGANQGASHQHVHSPEEIMMLIGQSHEGGLLDAEERELLDNALRAGELTAGEIAVPRIRMIAAEQSMPISELLQIATTSAYTRIPVYEEDIDHITGFVHLKDLFRLHYTQKETSIQSVLRKVPYIPETMPTRQVWETLDRHQSYLAIVIDEYGGTAGMLTREDLIEELFGELQDEFDTENPLITRLENGQYKVRGDILIEHLNHRLDIDLPIDEAHTIGGLVLQVMGRIPQIGESVKIQGINLRVQAVTNRAIEELLLTLPKAAGSQDEIR